MKGRQRQLESRMRCVGRFRIKGWALPANCRVAIVCAAVVMAEMAAAPASGQTGDSSAAPPALPLVHPSAPGDSGPPVTLTLQDVIERARKYDAGYWTALLDAKIAREDAVQARAAMLPSVSNSTQELLTKGNGTLPGGRYVTNDGIHVYREWAVVHQDFSPNTYLLHGFRRASVAEAVANAKAEIARRGLVVAVTRDYYTYVVAQRKYATAQQALATAQRFLTISREREQGGEVAHSDAIKAELQYAQQRQAFQEAELAMDNARIALAVFVSPNFNENLTVIDDLGSAQPLPPFSDVRAMAERENPTLAAATKTVKLASLDVSAARLYFLPSLTIDVDYGIEANAFATRSVVSADPKSGVLPNLGHFVTANLTIPIFDWGTNRSKLKQAVYKEQQARVGLTQTQREVLSNLYSFYNEAAAARAEQGTLHHAAELAAESLRLIGLRYQSGESTAQELVDAQNALTQARNADDDGQVRYRVALANLQTLTGNF
jgi:outer membrane protein TolC